MEGIYLVDFTEDEREPTVTEQDDNPSDDDLKEALRRQADERAFGEDDPRTDDEMWDAYQRATGDWKGEDS